MRDEPLKFTGRGLLLVDCTWCGGDGWMCTSWGQAEECSSCRGSGREAWDPRPLINNLAVAGALQQSYALGVIYAMTELCDGTDDDDVWIPGAGRPWRAS